MIEDIGYLKEHSIKESYMFLVDSKERDKTSFPHPEKYKIEFSSPFKHVYSFEVLDASIPRTQYAIDLHNNKLVYRYGDLTKTSVNYSWNTIEIPIGDYNDTNLISIINDKFIENHQSDNFFFEIRNVSSPSDLKSTFEFVSLKDFELDMHTSTLNTVLGFDLYNLKESSKYNNYYNFEPSNNYHINFFNNDSEEIKELKQKRWFGSIQTKGLSQENIVVFDAYSSPNFLGEYYTLEPGHKIYQQFTVDSRYDYGDIYHIEIELNQISSHTLDNIKYYIVDNPGDNLENQVSSLMKGYQYYLVIENSSNSEGNVMINMHSDVSESDTTNTKLYSVPNNNDITPINESESTQNRLTGLSVCFELKLYRNLKKIIAPGMYSLLGERYMLLRCKEIEDHLFRSRAYEKYTLGLAKFKLSVQGYEDARFDFATTPPREFHPIGKLSSLTFEFTNQDGSLYNFRGVNHTITFVIRYYTPIQLQTQIEKSMLNQNYDPDTFRYIQNKDYITDSEDDSDHDNDSIEGNNK